ncbi:MAG: flagellar assembly protein FliW [Helicobacteraceae bacterium]|jgi:flagellar assembly factor FliW|nr:flagellar assembly protein FliW [Helicobacteraceae bacterium]
MKFKIKAPILGFDQVKEVDLQESDELFAAITDTDNSGLAWTLVNPYHLREYSFDLTPQVQETLKINEKSNLLVYNVLVRGNATDDSVINFLAPIVFNKDEQIAAQLVLDGKQYPEFGVAQKLSEFVPSAQ